MGNELSEVIMHFMGLMEKVKSEMIRQCLSMLVLMLALANSRPEVAHAYMTLFNDTGDWTAVTLVNPDDGKTTHRACKNSRDRNQNERSVGSLAIICVTASYDDNTAKLGVWHSKTLAEPGEEIFCAIQSDGEEPVSRHCKILSSRFGHGQIVLTDDKAEIGALLKHKRLSVRLGEHDSEPLEFELDSDGLQKAAKELRDFF